MGFRDDLIAKATVNGKPLKEVFSGEFVVKEPMNKLEQQYAWFLGDLLKAGLIRGWRFESLKVRLADRTWYTPDFCVLFNDGMRAMVETKGWCRDDAAVKFKIAEELYPEYVWMMIGKVKGTWKVMRGTTIQLLHP